MSSIRKWIASKMFPPITPGGNNQTNGSPDGLPFFRSFSRSSTPGGSAYAGAGHHGQLETNSSRDSPSDQSYFYSIYSHYQPGDRKLSNNRNDQHLVSDLYQFYYANEDLNFISGELDTFDGRKDTDRCTALVNSLKLAQDRVITLIFRIMDELGCQRATREYRLKFPDELLAGEGIESLNSQIWFGAECLAAGSTITNNHVESTYLRPIANNLTTTLENIRMDLRICCDYLPKRPKITKELIQRLEDFDCLFTSFEYDYVKAMLPIKTSDDIESLQELTYLFSETLAYSLQKSLISKEDVDGCEPNVMIALPRLSIVRGLLHGYGSVVCKLNCDELSSILQPYHSLLLKFHEFLINLNDDELNFLEQLLSTNYQNTDPNLNDDILCEYITNQNDLTDQSNILNYYNKFMKCAKKYRHLNQVSYLGRVKYSKAVLNKYISASVDLLMISNKGDELHAGNHVRFSPVSPSKNLSRSLSLPNISFHDKIDIIPSGAQVNTKVSHKSNPAISSPSSSSTFVSTNSSLESASNSYPTFSSLSSSSASSLSSELDFLTQFKEILKQSHKSSLARHRSRANAASFRSFSSNCPPTSAFPNDSEMDENCHQRAKTTTGIHSEQGTDGGQSSHFHTTTPSASAFSNNSMQIDLDSIHFDELSQLTICKKKILHQVFVMISKIADKFQTTYASELRNILRTVFLLQEIEEAKENAKNQMDVSYVPIDVQLAHYSSDNVDLGTVEEGIDANEFMIEQVDDLNASTSDASHQVSPCIPTVTSNDCENCDNCESTNSVANVISNRSNSFEESLPSKQTEVSVRDERNSTFVSSSTFLSIKDSSACSRSEPVLGTATSSKVSSQSLPTLLDRNSTGVPHNYHHQLTNSSSTASSTTSLSSHSPQQSQFTASTATTIEERYDLPTFYLPQSDFTNSSPYFAHSMMPIPETESEPSPSSITRNLLLPPTWIPDELVSTCSLCAQVFNLIRRRHHCRRCGNIFCHQCSNNFIHLKCFGYAKPVRVCNRCLVLHEQESSLTASHVSSTTAPSTTTTTTTPYGAA